MSERVEKLDVDVLWEPNAPEAHLLVGDFGDVVLALNAHDNDPDERCVVLSWSGACEIVNSSEISSGATAYMIDMIRHGSPHSPTTSSRSRNPR